MICLSVIIVLRNWGANKLDYIWTNAAVSNYEDIGKALDQMGNELRNKIMKENKNWINLDIIPIQHSICFNSVKEIYVIIVLFEVKKI